MDRRLRLAAKAKLSQKPLNKNQLTIVAAATSTSSSSSAIPTPSSFDEQIGTRGGSQSIERSTTIIPAAAASAVIAVPTPSEYVHQSDDSYDPDEDDRTLYIDHGIQNKSQMSVMKGLPTIHHPPPPIHSPPHQRSIHPIASPLISPPGGPWENGRVDSLGRPTSRPFPVRSHGRSFTGGTIAILDSAEEERRLDERTKRMESSQPGLEHEDSDSDEYSTTAHSSNRNIPEAASATVVTGWVDPHTRLQPGQRRTVSQQLPQPQQRQLYEANESPAGDGDEEEMAHQVAEQEDIDYQLAMHHEMRLAAAAAAAAAASSSSSASAAV